MYTFLIIFLFSHQRDNQLLGVIIFMNVWCCYQKCLWYPLFTRAASTCVRPGKHYWQRLSQGKCSLKLCHVQPAQRDAGSSLFYLLGGFLNKWYYIEYMYVTDFFPWTSLSNWGGGSPQDHSHLWHQLQVEGVPKAILTFDNSLKDSSSSLKPLTLTFLDIIGKNSD